MVYHPSKNFGSVDLEWIICGCEEDCSLEKFLKFGKWVGFNCTYVNHIIKIATFCKLTMIVYLLLYKYNSKANDYVTEVERTNRKH